jgi:RHS repeat-associated protein
MVGADGSLTIQFAYNGDGVRTSKTVAGETTEYALDLLATLPVVISDTDAVYLYGLDIIAQQQTERLYYMHDGLGSVRQLVDTTGQVEANYGYDPFGVPVVEGDESNPYRYTGEAWDAEVGRFITKDPWMGDVQQPATVNRYVYVRNSPVDLVDPNGLQCVGPGCPQRVATPTMGPEPQDAVQPTPPPISATDVEQDTVRCDTPTGPPIRRSGATPTPTVARIPEQYITAVGDEGQVLLHQRSVVSGDRVMTFILFLAARVDQSGDKEIGIVLPVMGKVKSSLTAMVSTYNNGTYVDIYGKYDTFGLMVFDSALAFPASLMRSVEVRAPAADSQRRPREFPGGIPAGQTGEGHLDPGLRLDADEGVPSKVVMNLWVPGLGERGIIVTWGDYRLGGGVTSYQVAIPSD